MYCYGYPVEATQGNGLACLFRATMAYYVSATDANFSILLVCMVHCRSGFLSSRIAADRH